MSAETADDLAGFFDQEDFGEGVVYRPAGGSVLPEFDAIFQRPTETAFNQNGAPVAQRVAILTFPEALVPAGAKDGDTLTVRGLDYKVRSPEPDGTGLVTIRLERA